MTDSFKRHARSMTSPPENALAVTPGDSAVLARTSRAIYVGVSGHLTVRMLGGGVVTFANVQAGTLLPLRVDQVRATGTTAQSIVSVW